MTDPYKVLGVQKNAGADEIRKAYRKLAHVYHPDMPGGNLSKFIELGKAYEILSDPDKRRAFDLGTDTGNHRSENPTQNSPPPDPNACQTCGKRAPLRQVKFSQNVALFVVRQSKSIEGRLCKECIETYFWKYTLTTFLMGWWGIISFFVTFINLFNNIVTFVKAYSLPRANAQRRSKHLAWSVLTLILGFFTVVLVTAVRSEATAQYLAETTYVPVIGSSGRLSKEPAPSAAPNQYVSLSNGTVLYQNVRYITGMGELTIDNGTSNDAVVKLINVSSNKSVYTVYVRSNNSLLIDTISDGDYKLLFNLGNDWNAEHSAFETNSSYESFEEIFDFRTTDDEYTTFSVTLNPVASGNARTGTVNPEDFGRY